MKFMTYFNQ